MKIELTQEQTFTARAGTHAVHGLRRAAQWEGLSKLVDQSDRFLIVSDDNGIVVKGTPALLHDLRLTTSVNRFITVPETTLPTGQVVPSFKVGQYACSKGEDGAAVINMDGAPWVNVDYRDARAACQAIGASLITELQCLAIATDIVRQDVNWTGGRVGEGALYQGIHKGNVSGPQAGTYESEDPAERRWHQLSNGERIYDFAGNVFTWVFDDVQGTDEGLVSDKIAKDSPSLACAPFPSREKGVGYVPSGLLRWSGGALIRGGCWCSGSDAGVFRLLGGWPGGALGYVGFRCTKPIGL
jgi:formylglycine-generating enzyme required for sulfatase activity